PGMAPTCYPSGKRNHDANSGSRSPINGCRPSSRYGPLTGNGPHETGPDEAGPLPKEPRMAPFLSSADQLKRLFAALAEQTFQVEYGLADPPLIDYLSDILVRFVRLDAIFKVRDVMGRRLEEVADMLMEAEQRESNPKREIHRHIGDFTLFWTGVYPEALRRLRGFDRKDAL